MPPLHPLAPTSMSAYRNASDLRDSQSYSSVLYTCALRGQVAANGRLVEVINSAYYVRYHGGYPLAGISVYQKQVLLFTYCSHL